MQKIRRAIRAVIFDKNGKIAVLEVNNGDHYKIPGGKNEKGETEEETLRREVREEAGCKIQILEKIGESEFLSEKKDTLHHSVCYLARCIGKKFDPFFDDFETQRNFKLLWVDNDKIIKLFESTHPENFYDKTITDRDLVFIKKARRMIKK